MVLFDVVHFHAVFGQSADVPNVVLVAVQELVEGLEFGKFPHLHFVLALTKFAPHGVEHHLGQGATSGIVLHLVVIQVDAFLSGVVVEVLGLAFLGPTVGGPPAGLFFDLQPSVDVLGEEPVSALGKMPHFVDFQYHVALLDGFVQFGGAPGARQRSLCVGVRTLPGLGVQGSVQLGFHAGPAQREGQFVPGAIGQDGMVQTGRRQHGTFGQTKVGMEVHGVGGVDELRVPHGVAGVLVLVLVCQRESDPGGWPDMRGRRRRGDRMGRTRWGTGSGHRRLGNQSTHSAGNRHNGWDCGCRHVDRHDCRPGNKRSRNRTCQKKPAGWSGHRNDRLRAGSPGVGHRDHKRNTRRPDWRPPPPVCSRAGPGRTGAAHRRHTVPDGPRLSGGVAWLNSVGVGALAGRLATGGVFAHRPGR